MLKKQVVRYSGLLFTPIVGQSATVYPVDHPDMERVTNGQMAYTSSVVSYDETTGQFETQNTLYVPA